MNLEEDPELQMRMKSAEAFISALWGAEQKAQCNNQKNMTVQNK